MNQWTQYVARYRQGEWRTPIFRDMVVADVGRFARPALLDIGCGNGFDGQRELQEELARRAGEYIGIEPDPAVRLGPQFSRVYHCLFEEAPLAATSVDLAFAVMVLEHLTEPKRFWDRLWHVLRPGGVFWGFTVDARHWFCHASMWMKRLGCTDYYLHHFLRHVNGDEDYRNYPVYYRANSPRQVLPLVQRFGRCDFISFARVGQLDYYLPRSLQPLSARFDRSLIARGKPGAILAIRLVKER